MEASECRNDIRGSMRCDPAMPRANCTLYAETFITRAHPCHLPRGHAWIKIELRQRTRNYRVPSAARLIDATTRWSTMQQYRDNLQADAAIEIEHPQSRFAIDA